MKDTTPTAAPEIDLSALSLDRLRRIAAESKESTLRSAAKRTIADRLRTTADAPATTFKLTLGQSTFGTPQPEILIASNRGGDAYREVRATMFETAARIERTLYTSRERWLVELRRISDREGAVYLELMEGTESEIERAMSALRLFLPRGATTEPVIAPAAVSGAAKPAKPKRDLKAEADRRKAKLAAQAATATEPDPRQLEMPPEPTPQPPAAEEIPLQAVAVPSLAAAEAEVQQTGPLGARQEKRRWRELVGNEVSAAQLEKRALSVGREHLPPFAVAVLDGQRGGREYYSWLIASFEAAAAKATEAK